MEKYYLDTIEKHISDNFKLLKLESNLQVRKHPIEEISYALEHPNSTKGIYQYALITAKAIYCLDREKRLENWFKQKWKEAEERKDNCGKAVGVLGEYRALYYLLSTREKIIPIPDTKKIQGKENNSSPDFKLKIKNKNIYFEVFTPRIKETALKEINNFLNKERKSKNNKKITVSTIGYNPVYDKCCKNEDKYEYECSKVYTIKRRILSNKAYAEQVCPNAVNILWIDLISPEWNYSKAATKPFIVINDKEETFIGTNGIWHAFYGDCETKIIKNETSLKCSTKHDFVNQSFKGYFCDNHKWSGVILAFTDGIVFFENPLAEYPISKDQFKYLSRMKGFDFSLSWINIYNGYLINKIENTKKELEYMCNLNDE